MKKQSFEYKWNEFLFGIYQKHGFWSWFSIVAVMRIFLFISYLFVMPILAIIVFLWATIKAFIEVIKYVFSSIFNDLSRLFGRVFELRLAFTKRQEVEQFVRSRLERWKEKYEQNH